MLLIIFISFLLISFLVGRRLKGKMRRYQKVAIASNLSGCEVAQRMLADHGIQGVRVTCTPGELTDHYNPLNRTVNLSEQVYAGHSVASAAVAAHECGHAVQHARAYSLLRLRSALVPVQNMSARVLNMVFMMMFFGAIAMPSILPFRTALLVIIACYAVLTSFAFVTLPVEFDASRRALVWIKRRGVVTRDEHKMAGDALQAAAMTYVVAALSALSMLLYYVMLFLGSRD